jgi:hypothetical protein
MSKGVRREYLIPQDDEVTDQPRCHGDATSRDECVAHELEREHVLQTHVRASLAVRVST